MPGPLSASDERHLYDTDRPAWLRHVAPRMARRLADSKDRAGDIWGQLPRDYQHAVWPLLDRGTQAAIRANRAA